MNGIIFVPAAQKCKPFSGKPLWNSGQNQFNFGSGISKFIKCLKQSGTSQLSLEADAAGNSIFLENSSIGGRFYPNGLQEATCKPELDKGADLHQVVWETLFWMWLYIEAKVLCVFTGRAVFGYWILMWISFVPRGWDRAYLDFTSKSLLWPLTLIGNVFPGKLG